MWVLIGHYNAHYPEEDYDENVALFYSREDAEQYEKDSRMRAFKRIRLRGDKPNYRKISLLRGYDGASVEEYEVEDLPIDPIPITEFSQSVAKFVRRNHVQTDEHWSHQEIIKNEIKED